MSSTNSTTKSAGTKASGLLIVDPLENNRPNGSADEDHQISKLIRQQFLSMALRCDSSKMAISAAPTTFIRVEATKAVLALSQPDVGLIKFSR
ncbi:hypothetical protein DAPPUDRAFT_233681 [Daphnia pulex]|uniref:Uncharacterized protein n=1 Tax=Daphnia pulex TaxID=6669 RepID=E9FVF7_DAPPU|nr:hypothetical protein DAPPUDRAFT_233681 [Daphnia pulex]|eukprot:EFX88546.1 hypothetical protein DAPPUDRAFT_233681 [Daphnia pulex]